MNCHRCHGLMVQDRAYDLQDTHIHCDVWRCLCCGNMFDAQMLSNKKNCPVSTAIKKTHFYQLNNQRQHDESPHPCLVQEEQNNEHA